MTAAGGIALIVVGAILAFALRTGTAFGLNLQIVGVILILAGMAGLVLPRLARTRRRSSLLIGGSDQNGLGSSGLDRDSDRREAAAEDVAAVRSDDQYFRYGPGNQRDEL
jgi:hypothetical protein